jgi:hypothetical protein
LIPRNLFLKWPTIADSIISPISIGYSKRKKAALLKSFGKITAMEAGYSFNYPILCSAYK